MEQDEIIRTVTPGVTSSKKYPHSHENDTQSKKAEGETSWVTKTKRKRTQGKDSLEFPSMETTLISFLVSVNLCL